MEIDEYRSKFNPIYSNHLKNKINKTKRTIEDDVLITALDTVYQIFGHKGKRLRPYITYLMYVSAGGKDEEQVISVGVALELLHSFALVHDDYIDRGNIRHDTITVHENIKKSLIEQNARHDLDHLSNSQAVLIGDMILAWAYGALNSSKITQQEKVFRSFQNMIEQVVLGEMMDVSMLPKHKVSQTELKIRDYYKTSSYTFINPMLIGATLADKELEYKVFCNKAGELLGEVYQIQDDLWDVLGEKGATKFTDIRDRQHTFLTQYVLTNGTKKERDTLKRLYADKKSNVALESQVIDILLKPKVINYAINESKTRLVEVKTLIMAAEFDHKHELLWMELIKFFEQRFD